MHGHDLPRLPGDDDQTILESPPWLQVFINSLPQNVTEGTDSEDFCLVKMFSFSSTTENFDGQ